MERRQQVKYKYCNRKVLWGCMERLMDRGNDVNTVIAKIKRCYGDCTMTQLIQKMRPDEIQGGHYQLSHNSKALIPIKLKIFCPHLELNRFTHLKHSEDLTDCAHWQLAAYDLVEQST
eukprot:jgi/Psemu1/13191/gm1.13191_g